MTAVKTRDVAVQVNGKLRAVLTIEEEYTESEIVPMAKLEVKVSAALSGHEVKKIVYIPGRVLNFVTN
jgi:leucyl-tRNA synthetase